MVRGHIRFIVSLQRPDGSFEITYYVNIKDLQRINVKNFLNRNISDI